MTTYTADISGFSVALLRSDINAEKKPPEVSCGARAATYSEGSARKYAIRFGSMVSRSMETLLQGRTMSESVHSVTSEADTQSITTVKEREISLSEGGSLSVKAKRLFVKSNSDTNPTTVKRRIIMYIYYKAHVTLFSRFFVVNLKHEQQILLLV